MAIKFEKIIAGSQLYSIRRYGVGNTTMTALGWYPVDIVSIDPETRTAQVRWNGNRIETYNEKTLTSLYTRLPSAVLNQSSIFRGGSREKNNDPQNIARWYPLASKKGGAPPVKPARTLSGELSDIFSAIRKEDPNLKTGFATYHGHVVEIKYPGHKLEERMTRTEATTYLAWLTAGNRGPFSAMNKEKKP